MGILIAVNCFFGIVLGEACRLYYLFGPYDKFMHFFASVELAFDGFLIGGTLSKHKSTPLFLCFFAFFFAVGGSHVGNL